MCMYLYMLLKYESNTYTIQMTVSLFDNVKMKVAPKVKYHMIPQCLSKRAKFCLRKIQRY